VDALAAMRRRRKPGRPEAPLALGGPEAQLGVVGLHAAPPVSRT